MKIGYIFPGQGTQTVGMGKDIYEKYGEAREIYSRVDNVLGEKIEDITYNLSQEELNQTKNTQIAIYTMSLSILEILNKAGIKAEAAAGLSLGEYTALTYANAISVEEGAKIVRTRGRLMQDLAPEGDWSMAAIIGMEDDKVEEVCSKVEKGFVKAVNYNCPGQVVVSGEKEAVLRAMEIAKEMGARKAIELKTSGPFHTEKLKDASNELRKELEKISFNKCEISVIKNLDGTFYKENDDIKDILANHIINPVRFDKAIKLMQDEGVEEYVEIGPGKVLTGFIKKENRDAVTYNINSLETLEEYLNK